jgi:hypothetical protein
MDFNTFIVIISYCLQSTLPVIVCTSSQTGAEEYAFRNFTPYAASSSRFGVSIGFARSTKEF